MQKGGFQQEFLPLKTAYFESGLALVAQLRKGT